MSGSNFCSAFFLVLLTILVSLCFPQGGGGREVMFLFFFFCFLFPYFSLAETAANKQFPPLGVFLVAGCGADLLINVCLTVLGYVRYYLIHLSIPPSLLPPPPLFFRGNKEKKRKERKREQARSKQADPSNIAPRPHPRLLRRVRVLLPPRGRPPRRHPHPPRPRRLLQQSSGPDSRYAVRHCAAVGAWVCVCVCVCVCVRVCV